MIVLILTRANSYFLLEKANFLLSPEAVTFHQYSYRLRVTPTARIPITGGGIDDETRLQDRPCRRDA